MPSIQAQVDISFAGEVDVNLRESTMEQIMAQPTVRLAKRLIISVCLASGWSYESQDEETSDWLRETFKKWEHRLIRSALLSHLQHGWKAYHLEFGLENDLRVITNIKGMRHNLCTPVYDDKTGQFLAVVMEHPNSGNEYRVNYPEALMINFDESLEGKLARPLVEAAEDPYKWWRDTNLTANRFDRKLAGGFIIVHYPVGKSMYKGTLTDNGTIAEELLEALQGVGTAKIPHDVQDTLDEMNGDSGEGVGGWKIEMIGADTGAQGAFTDRLKYLDAQILRALGWTERSVTEGQFGTKAEAGEHADMALLNMHTMLEHMTEELNYELVKPLVEYNFGSDRRAHLKANELSDTKKQLFKELLMAIFTASPTTALEIVEKIDNDSLLDVLNIPYNYDEDQNFEDNLGFPV